MASTGLKDRVLESLFKYRERYESEFDALSKYQSVNIENDLYENMTNTVEKIFTLLKERGITTDTISDGPLKEVEDILRKDFENGNRPVNTNTIIEYYKASQRHALALIDIKKQETSLHLYEQFRFVLFRTLTAIAIAAVVIGTAIVAKELELTILFARFP